MNFDITKRLREPPFGTETSERLLMAQAADKIDALRQDNDRLEEENGELRYEPWPKWAKAVLAITRKRSGYDGYDDASDGVDLPAELEECFCEFEAEDEKQRKLIDTLRAENERLASKVSDLEASLHDEETRVRHYRELVEESRKRGKANRPDMFWLADDPEFSLESWEDALEDAGMSDAVRVQCARGMADRWVARRVVSVTDDGDWDETDVMLCDTREEAESLWETSLAAARAALSEAQP